MHIDWFVFFAQIVNFLLLIWLLKKFLYNRILQAMDAREAKIASTFEEAEKSREEARQASAQYEKKLQALNEEYEAMLNKTRADAEAYRKELMDRAREEVERVQTRWVETVSAEREAFLLELRRLAGEQIYAIARQVLKDLADKGLEDRIAEVLADRIRNLDEKEKTKFRESIKEEHRVIVQSAYEIAPEEKKKIAEVIRRTVIEDIELEYEQSPEVITGFEIKTDGHKLAWSVSDYLNTLEENFIQALNAESRQKKEAENKEGSEA
ncbi:MAG TPA: F0F1 ATP synthase subunit delta [Syntrophales bacterium]|nr:F0F1 ATP synthase subunit delta [Syntrophales bacterium]HOX93700.1 F0F1 ATP synthase subunit delta [Syntrophales bacterium]HPI56562.1 F0F1 ATP synthase subunit delta [Syntrophales bacterium]HPN25017.1 F0F1 ATP synthase subunit delta [Syntrophales bacterium]HQM29241.1 F0F1 ATP synthase subunit delta [Syntrophales bacterium]